MAYKAIVKAACKSDYETGNFTFLQISANRDIPEGVLRNWASAGKWEKGKLAPQVQAAVQEKTIDALARLGMSKDKALEILIDGMENSKEMFFGKQLDIKNYETILNYLKEYHKVIDAYPAQRIEIDIKSIQTKIVAVLVEFRDCLPEDKREYFKAKMAEVLQ